MEKKDIKETNQRKNETQHRNLPKLEDLKTDEDIIEVRLQAWVFQGART